MLLLVWVNQTMERRAEGLSLDRMLTWEKNRYNDDDDDDDDTIC
jgi:hypothetical protein